MCLFPVAVINCPWLEDGATCLLYISICISLRLSFIYVI